MKANTTVTMPWDVLDRMERAVEKVRERLLKATSALNQAGIAYAVAGGNAVASWVASVDEGAVRNTRDIDLLVRRADLPAVTTALEQAGFVPAKTFGVTTFLENPDAKPSESVHLLFAGEKVRDDYPLASPDVVTIDDPAGFRVLKLHEMVQMELILDRNKEHMHIRDMIGVGLIDQSWLAKLPPVLAERLKAILDTPES
ncbi:MAG: nucleotidyltransferase family protein [Planctomycetaceae bacterium]|nr:nucleotidyltransferase family protein [Planctomycetaceae bacterium]